jgi:uncharacterized membrane protein
MAGSRGARSVLATFVGYVLVAIIAYIAIRTVFGTFFWLIRTLVVVLAIAGLFTLYVTLKGPPEE